PPLHTLCLPHSPTWQTHSSRSNLPWQYGTHRVHRRDKKARGTRSSLPLAEAIPLQDAPPSLPLQDAPPPLPVQDAPPPPASPRCAAGDLSSPTLLPAALCLSVFLFLCPISRLMGSISPVQVNGMAGEGQICCRSFVPRFSCHRRAPPYLVGSRQVTHHATTSKAPELAHTHNTTTFISWPSNCYR
ncbi:unnamed protein product, partial [Urochloa humidicola]